MNIKDLQATCIVQHEQIRACSKRIREQRRQLAQLQMPRRTHERVIHKNVYVNTQETVDALQRQNEQLQAREMALVIELEQLKQKKCKGMCDELAECRWELKRVLRENAKLKRKKKK